MAGIAGQGKTRTRPKKIKKNKVKTTKKVKK